MPITDDHLQTYLDDGFVLVRDFLDQGEVRRATDEIRARFPDGEAYACDPHRFRDLACWIDFPYAGRELNRHATHPDIIAAVERLLGTFEIRAGRLKFQAKYPTPDPSDELLHIDGWGGNTIAYPRNDGIYRQLQMILYYTDVTVEHGPTHIVPRRHARGHDLAFPVYTRERHPDLYRSMSPVLATAGSLAIMDMTTVHCGSAIRAARGHRYVQFLTYGSARCPWLQTQSFPTTEPPVRSELRRFIEASIPRQREVIGFPSPGDAYWNDETCAGMAARYPAMDMTPYRQALARCPSADERVL